MATVAIPIETKAREFHGKLWLGLNLTQRGYSVVLGPSDEIKNTLYISEPDIYISKDPSDNNIELFSKLKKANCKICGLDTEGAVYPSLEDFGRNKRESLRYFDRYFLWGEAQTEFLQDRMDDSESLIPTGNPRFDLLNRNLRSIYSKNANSIRSIYGDYIIFNMNFSWANHYNSKKHLEQQKRLFGEYDKEKYSYVSILWNEFVAAIHYLQSKINSNIVVRPHPSEDHSTYEDIFKNYNSVFVEYSGDVRKWIAGASVIVHNSCTTGIESALMEQPVISYQPIKNKKYDKRLPNLVSDEVYSRKTLYDRISYYLDQQDSYTLTTEQYTELKRYFHNIDLLASELIANEIDSLEINSTTEYSHFKPELNKRFKLFIKSSNFSDAAIRSYDFFYKLINNSQKFDQRGYRAQKFPGLTRAEINNHIEMFNSFIDSDGTNLINLPLTNDSFMIKPA
jgi:surface carbohydrate biosynthesis protein